jgi:hypothetical protein
MHKCCGLAAGLLAWFLMFPPPVYPPELDASGKYKINAAAPMSQWIRVQTLDTEDACRAELLKKPRLHKCVASNDPALNASAPAAAGAPSTSTLSGAAGMHMQ